jgi:membrane protease YdiL (CAAX protease family)
MEIRSAQSNNPSTAIGSATSVEDVQKTPQIASWAHLTGFFLIGAGVVILGFLAQHAPASGGAAPGQLAAHNRAIPIYLTASFMDLALLYYCWVGVHHRNGNLETLSGGRWTSWRSLGVDLGIALPFWVVWEGTAYGAHWLLDPKLLGAGGVKTVASLLPESPLEILIWIVVSITAGVCEELAFRGYLQRQLRALSGNVVVAILAQGAVFGLFHSYQGWTNVIVISVLGVLYGMLAACRRNLHANMIAHAWSDIWGGWLQMLVWH